MTPGAFLTKKDALPTLSIIYINIRLTLWIHSLQWCTTTFSNNYNIYTHLRSNRNKIRAGQYFTHADTNSKKRGSSGLPKTNSKNERNQNDFRTNMLQNWSDLPCAPTSTSPSLPQSASRLRTQRQRHNIKKTSGYHPVAHIAECNQPHEQCPPPQTVRTLRPTTSLKISWNATNAIASLDTPDAHVFQSNRMSIWPIYATDVIVAP